VVLNTGRARAGGAAANRLVHQADRIAFWNRAGWPDYVFAFHDRDEIGSRMLARVAKHTGLAPDDL
jgi:hypothetical protein